ncbi:MAG: hypothetical protein WBP18_16945 [Paracoccaceae bacterium]|jgi:hypothetical protein
MDYSKSGSAHAAKFSPRPKRKDIKGAPQTAADDKAELLARMKAAAATKAGKTDEKG